MTSSPELSPDTPGADMPGSEVPSVEVMEPEAATPQLSGLDVASRVRARDIQMAGVADVRRRVLMISGAIDTTEHDVAVYVNLPEPGRWTVIKSETNLTDQTWVAIQATTDENSTFVNDEETLLLSRQFAKSFMSPDQRRLTFYDGEVRPGEAVLKMYTLETSGTRPAYSYSRYSPISTDSAEESAAKLDELVREGMPQRQVVEVIVPVTVIG
jgi:hypothetical protein